jgi:hypothetical protein
MIARGNALPTVSCVKCNKDIRVRCFCPVCKVSFCFKCWRVHLDSKVCAYGKTKVIEVQL